MWAGVANARPELVHKSEQPRRRGQAVLLRQVGSLTESWLFYPYLTLDVVDSSK